MIGEAAATGGIGAVVVVAGIGVVIFWARAWIGTRIREAIHVSAQKGLEEYKSDLRSDENTLLEEVRKLNTQLQAVQGTANAGLIEGQRVAAEWRAKTADAIWREVLRLRHDTPAVLTYLDILTPDEYQLFVTRTDLRELALSLNDERTWFWNPDAEQVRPFLGEELFLKFFIYRAWLGRVAYLLERDVRRGEVKPWFQDAGIRRQLLPMVLDEEELKQLDELPATQFSWTLNALEGKILDQLRKVVSGEVSTTESLEQARRVRALIQTLEADDRRYGFGSH